MSKHDVCPVEMAKWLDNPVRKFLQNPKKYLKKIIRPGDRIIDLGCGPGTYTTDLAEMAGPNGKVYAVDIQQEMLAMVEEKARKYRLTDRITLICPKDGGMEVHEPADVIFAFYMFHESKNTTALLDSIHSVLRPGGHFFLVEPKMHISRELYEKTNTLIRGKGFREVQTVRITASWGVIFRKEQAAHVPEIPSIN